MRTIAATVAATLISVSSLTAQSPAPAAPAPQLERSFTAGGSVHMELSAGQYTIRGTPDSKIRIRWTTRDPADARSVYTKADVSGRQARIDVSGPSNGFFVVIEVPSVSNVTVNLSAGDLTLGGLTGDKDISAWAGKLVVGVGDPADYHSVSASVTAGQIRADQFQAEKGGIFRSFSWDGKGRHSLRVRLTAGDVILQKGDTP